MSESPEQAALSEEDRARGYCYALISRLFYAAPDADLLQKLGGASSLTETDAGDKKDRLPESAAQAESSGSFTAAFEALQRACRSADPETVRQEYDDLFIGAGKAVVTPYTSGYSLPNAPDRHVVALRERLAGWGLRRRESVFEVEDHVSAICDVMRWLIEHEEPLEVQRAFFDEFVYSGLGPFCDAVDASASTTFYQAVAQLTRAFLTIEQEAFALHAAE